MVAQPDLLGVGDPGPDDAPAVLAAIVGLEAGALSGEAHGEGLRGRLAAAWAALAAGHPLDDAVLTQLEADARRRERARAVIDVASLRALSRADVGELDDALEHARRAARMGRTEQLPEAEYLAGLVLARLRRLTGRPYLATRIASALRRMASPRWHPWIDWEIVMAGGAFEPGADPPQAAAAAARLADTLARARAGERDGFDRGLGWLRGHVQAFAFAARDLSWVEAAVDPEADLRDVPATLRAWCDGTSGYAPAPCGLGGLAGIDPSQGPTAGVGLVLAHRDRPGRRVLRVAEGLACASTAGHRLDGATVGRTEAIVSALALRGPAGAIDADVFADAYGFAFSAPVHRGAFDVALHRARARVEPYGRIDRSDGRIALHVQTPFVVADPRSIPGTDDRVLAHLASGGALSARHLASGLGVPLRTVQDALRSLVEGGACRRDRAGRQILYAIEDTTFQEPTRERASGSVSTPRP